MTPRETPTESRLPRFSLERPIAVVVLLAACLVVGAVATVAIPIELIPKGYSEPFLSIFIPWREAPPREVLEKLTKPLEEELSTVQGLDRVTSVSQTGRSRVFLRLKQGTDMDLAYREVRDRIERARRSFPADVDRVYTFKFDDSAVPLFFMGVAIDSSVTDYYNLIQKQIVLPLERMDGMASVEVDGLEEKEILIELDRDRTHASGLNIYDLARDLGGDNFTMASGHVMDGDRKLLLRSVARYGSLEEVRDRLVGPGIRLKDIAAISYAEADKEYRVRAMSKPAYMVIGYKEGDANARQVCQELHRVVDRIKADPRMKDVVVELFFDQGEMIDEQMSTLLRSGAVGGFLAALVLFFFLRRFRVMVAVVLAIPLSLVIAVTVMYFAGESLNLLTLLSLMVCVGLLVDNSVVVAENIDRMHKGGLSRRDAAIRGASEIGLAITMSTLTTVVVFLPVSLAEGPAQFFLLRMAIPISVALLASLVVALVCIPLGVYVTLPRSETPQRTGFLVHGLNAGMARLYSVSFGRLNHLYNRLLARSLSRRVDLVLGTVILFAITMAVTGKTIKFVDVQENEEAGFEVDVEMPADYTLEETEEWFLLAEEVVESHAEELDLEGWFHFHRKNFGEIEGWFNNPRTNDLTPREVTERVVELLPKRAGMTLSTGDDSEAEKEGEGTYRVRLNGEDPAILDRIGRQLEDLFLGIDGVVGVRKTEDNAPNEMALVLDRKGTQRLGVNPMAVAGVVGYALRGQALPKHRMEGKEIPVRVRFREEDRQGIDQLSGFFVPTEDGDILPLSAVTDVRMLSDPETIVRRNKRITRSVAIDMKKGEEEETRKRLQALVRAIDLPEGITFDDQTAQQQLNEDLQGLIFAGTLSVIFIYLLMGLLFESFVLPLSIILTIPLASLGVLWIHIVSGLDLDFLGGVGIVLLIGVVVNNGIVLIDYVNRLRGEGTSRTEAILMSADRRFRPIMMTAITTIGGMIPLAIAGRMDSGLSYTSFALTLIGGMTTATLLTLLVVPVFYTLFDDMRMAFAGALKRVVARNKRARAA